MSVRKGRAFEYKVMRRLRLMGFQHVVRSPKSAFPDITAIRWNGDKHDIWLVECKLRGHFTREQEERLVRKARSIRARPVLAYVWRGVICFRFLDTGERIFPR